MRKLQALTSSVLLMVTPPMLVHSQDALPSFHFQGEKINQEAKLAKWNGIPSYDDMLGLFEKIEFGELEERCSPEELEKIKHFIVFLAKQGALPDHSEESLSLDDDIEALLHGEGNFDEEAAFLWAPNEYQYTVIPAVLNGHGEVVLCKSWVQKQWKHVKHFYKKHKKEIIIGGALVVGAGIVIGVMAASSAAVGAVVAAASSDHGSSTKEESISTPTDTSSGMATIHEAPALKSTIDHQISLFKDNVVQNQFFQPIDPTTGQQGLPWEETGRALGSLFAHDSLNHIQHQLPYYPRLSQELQEMHSKYTFPALEGNNSILMGHPEIDHKFSTDYTHLYSNPGQEIDFNTLSHQVRGETALAFGYYNQAVQDLGKAIEINPTNPIPYLERGVAHFGLGQYDQSLQDYEQFTAQTQITSPLSVSEFSLGLAKGLPQGLYESGTGILLFLTDFIKHPIHTSGQVIDSFTALAALVRNDEWGVISEALSPEIHQLVTEWDTLTAGKRGELAGYAIGKHGADIFIPGALTKIASQGLKGAQELTSVCKKLQRAQETLVLEAAAEIGNSAKVAEVVGGWQETAFCAEELGFTAREMGQLKQIGQLEETVKNALEHLSLPMQDSIKLFEEAGNKLKPYQGIYMPESQVRELLHATGIPTFQRPKGIPENYRIKLSDKPGGIKYVHPTDEGTYVRIMPGKAHSKNPSQQKPYVNQRKNGKSLDKHGNIVSNKSEEAHIPIEEFIYR